MTVAVGGVHEMAAALHEGRLRAAEIVDRTLARIEARNGILNCFTAVCARRARDEAAAIDADRSADRTLRPLAGVPYAVKNLFDVTGLPTLAGSKINAARAPAVQDATAIRRLKAAGAILVGTLNMDEYACGLTTENTHYGPTHNPDDLNRIAGGSSGGSAAAVADGLVPFSLGSDTNGSVRVPASLCGVFALKPTFGRLSRAGMFPFAASLDHVGLFARSVKDLAAVYDVLQGPDPADPACVANPPDPASPSLLQGSSGLRIAVAGGYFEEGAEPEAIAAVAHVAQALQANGKVILPEAGRARAAAAIITACESGNLHLSRLRARFRDFDPLTRARIAAGALVPAAWYIQAQRFRRWYRDAVLRIFRKADIILAPATPCSATRIGQETMSLDGVEMPTRLTMGIYTQPLSFIGLPVVVVPVRLAGRMPIGVQIIGAPWREADCLRAAAAFTA